MVVRDNGFGFRIRKPPTRQLQQFAIPTSLNASVNALMITGPKTGIEDQDFEF